jgi:hypothetical protein
MTDTAKRMYGPAQPGTSTTTLYTVPALTTSIVRNIHVANTATVAKTITFGFGGTAATAANLFAGAVSIPANTTYDWSGFLVMIAADTITALQETATSCTVIISGVEVS